MLRKLSVIFFCCGVAHADVLLYKAPSEQYSVSMGATAYQEFGSRTQGRTYSISANNNNGIDFDSAASVHLSMRYDVSSDVVVGFQLGVAANNLSSSQAGLDRLDRSYIWIENNKYGRVEYGSNTGAAVSMETSGTTLAVATGGANGSWYKYFNSSTLDRNGETEVSGDSFLLAPGLVFPDDNFQALSTNERVRKLTYYAPKYDGVQFAISYMPDTRNYGSVPAMPNRTVSGDRRPKNGVSAGITWEKTFAPYKELTVALIGEYGTLERSAEDKINKRKFYNPSVFEIGFNYRYNSFVYGASYGQQWRSDIEKIPGVPNIYFMTAGVKYDITSDLRASVSYFYSEKFHNIANVIGVGGEYSIYPGFLPYIDVVYINMQQKHIYNGPAYNESGVATLSRSNFVNDGMAFITGMKISF